MAKRRALASPEDVFNMLIAKGEDIDPFDYNWETKDLNGATLMLKDLTTAGSNDIVLPHVGSYRRFLEIFGDFAEESLSEVREMLEENYSADQEWFSNDDETGDRGCVECGAPGSHARLTVEGGTLKMKDVIMCYCNDDAATPYPQEYTFTPIFENNKKKKVKKKKAATTKGE